jgi:glycerol-3-phosphate cytidylyltransferase
MPIKIGFTCGAFDLCHSGHLILFSEAKRHCDYLIVGLQVDPSFEREDKEKPVETIFERYLRLVVNRNINQIIPYETEEDLYAMLLWIKPKIRFIDERWRGKETGKDLKIEIYYVERKHNYSSTNLRKRIKETK